MCFVILVAELGSSNGWQVMCEDRVGVHIIPCWGSVNVCSWPLNYIHSRTSVIQDSSVALRKASQQFTLVTLGFLKVCHEVSLTLNLFWATSVMQLNLSLKLIIKKKQDVMILFI